MYRIIVWSLVLLKRREELSNKKNVVVLNKKSKWQFDGKSQRLFSTANILSGYAHFWFFFFFIFLREYMRDERMETRCVLKRAVNIMYISDGVLRACVLMCDLCGWKWNNAYGTHDDEQTNIRKEETKDGQMKWTDSRATLSLKIA